MTRGFLFSVIFQAWVGDPGDYELCSHNYKSEPDSCTSTVWISRDLKNKVQHVMYNTRWLENTLLRFANRNEDHHCFGVASAKHSETPLTGFTGFVSQQLLIRFLLCNND